MNKDQRREEKRVGEEEEDGEKGNSAGGVAVTGT